MGVYRNAAAQVRKRIPARKGRSLDDLITSGLSGGFAASIFPYSYSLF